MCESKQFWIAKKLLGRQSIDLVPHIQMSQPAVLGLFLSGVNTQESGATPDCDVLLTPGLGGRSHRAALGRGGKNGPTNNFFNNNFLIFKSIF